MQHKHNCSLNFFGAHGLAPSGFRSSKKGPYENEQAISQVVEAMIKSNLQYSFQSTTCSKVPSLQVAVKFPKVVGTPLAVKSPAYHLQQSFQATACIQVSESSLAVEFPACLRSSYRQSLTHPLQWGLHLNSGKRNLPAHARQVDIAMQFGT